MDLRKRRTVLLVSLGMALAAWAGPSLAASLDAVEKLLPQKTFFYVGVNDLNAAFARTEKFLG